MLTAPAWLRLLSPRRWRLATIGIFPDASCCWYVQAPIDEAGRNIAALLLAVAELEQRNPFLRIIDSSISQDSENPTQRVVVLDLDTLYPEEGVAR
jgi:hypothetical protein